MVSGQVSQALDLGSKACHIITSRQVVVQAETTIYHNATNQCHCAAVIAPLLVLCLRMSTEVSRSAHSHPVNIDITPRYPAGNTSS